MFFNKVLIEYYYKVIFYLEFLNILENNVVFFLFIKLYIVVLKMKE